MTTLELIERGVGHNCLSDAYDLGKADAIQDIRVEIANRLPSRPITKRAREVWEDKYWLLINLDKELEQMQKGADIDG